MPIVKNTFLQSKMNKDMDGRILPNGQYRDGRNIQISRSEGDDVGALENVLGNGLLTTFGFTNQNLEIIGHLMVDTIDTIFLFLTDYYDSSSDQLSNNISGIAGECYIVSFNTRTSTSTILVEGNFLNFSKSHPIIGINLIEELLFWTDNRNQPRKINISLANQNYYTTEDQISVAKYYPYEPILLLNPVNNTHYKFESSMRDKVSPYLPIHAAAKVKAIDNVTGTIDLYGTYTNIMPTTPGFPGPNFNGDLMTGYNVSSKECIVETVTIVGIETTVEVPPSSIGTLEDEDIVYFQRQNPDYDPTWTGDSNYLKDKFVRFSYRFKFDDGEYSLSAPFTQIAFVPQQDGYFIGDSAQDSTGDNKIRLVGQESETYDSTVVRFMENKINDINLSLLSPTEGNLNESITWNNVREKLKITEIDILYKEANSNKITIVDTLLEKDFNSINDSILQYNYKSTKPWKTLPPSQTTRVSDVVPVRALAQESSGNRIIYGNYIDKHTSPINLNYQIQVNEKVALPDGPTSPFIDDSNSYVRKEYQNHTLKQNRNYQVGVVLSDRYGRQSNVILSSLIDTTLIGNLNSTFYHTYRSVEDAVLMDKYPGWPTKAAGISSQETPITWPGDQINAIFWSIIPELKTSEGYPGLYTVADGTVNQLTEITATPNFGVAQAGCCYTADIAGENSGATARITFCISPTGDIIDIEVVSSGDGWLNGDGFYLVNWVGPFAGPACDPTIEPFDINGFISTPIDNPLGWYSYKFVVKQTEQEYYNVYLPGALAGYPRDQDGVEGIDATTGTITTDSGPPVVDTVATNESQAFPTVAFDYPKGQQRHTSHIVLFGDNINKVPKDLQDVGPLTEQFRSSEFLYGRVNTILLGSNEEQSNMQYDPGQEWDIAVQIGSMVSLGLGDLTINPIVPTLPPSFYKADTNPLIARVETKNQFGIVNAIGGTIYPYGPCLAVYETKPVESLLDIFWETTTSGLISELNHQIKTVDNTVPVGITTPNISWSEADDFGSYISATFEAAGSYGQGIGPLASISLTQVTRGDNTVVTPQFELEEQGVGTGEYQIKTTPYNVNNEGFLCWDDNLKNIYYFDLLVTYDNGIDPVLNIAVQSTGYIVNSEPIQKEFPGLGTIKAGVLSGDTVLTCDIGYPAGPYAGNYNASSNAGKVAGGEIRANGTQLPGSIPTADNKLMMDANSGSKDWGGSENWSTQLSHFTKGLPQPCSGTGLSLEYSTTDTLAAANGSYGSISPTPFPRSIYNGNEISFDISRMYQISMYLPWYQMAAIQGAQNLPGWRGGPYYFGSSVSPPVNWYDKNGTFELIFGYNSYIPPDSSISGVGDFMEGIPTGPIYWDFDNPSQIDPNLGGEATVGALYNGNQHYWADLEQIRIDQDANPPSIGNGIMQLQEGANTFYSMEGPVRWGFNALRIGFSPDVFQTTQFVLDNTVPLNNKGYQFYLGGLDTDGVGPPRSINNMRFHLQEQALQYGAGNFTNPRRAKLFCSNPLEQVSGFNSINKSLFWWNPEIDGAGLSLDSTNETTVVGNTIPAGRYVVTVRATDKNGAGLITEWDLPITIPPNYNYQKTTEDFTAGSFTSWAQNGGANGGCQL